MSDLIILSDKIDKVASGKGENASALYSVQFVEGLESKHKLAAKRWRVGAANWKDVSSLRRLARRLRELDHSYGEGEMVTKERWAVKMKNGGLAMDERINMTRTFTTKREALQEFGDDANVIKVRVMVEEIVVAPK